MPLLKLVRKDFIPRASSTSPAGDDIKCLKNCTVPAILSNLLSRGCCHHSPPSRRAAAPLRSGIFVQEGRWFSVQHSLPRGSGRGGEAKRHYDCILLSWWFMQGGMAFSLQSINSQWIAGEIIKSHLAASHVFLWTNISNQLSFVNRQW